MYGEGTREDRARQGAVLGGVGGAVVGAASSENPLLGALLGGALGAGGGYLIGANVGALRDGDAAAASDAEDAIDRARRNPASPDDVRDARTADLNSDGFVTTDELVAMDRAGLSDTEMIERLEATGQIFELTSEQERRLREAGVSSYVISEMQRIRAYEREELLGQIDVIGR